MPFWQSDFGALRFSAVRCQSALKLSGSTDHPATLPLGSPPPDSETLSGLKCVVEAFSANRTPGANAQGRRRIIVRAGEEQCRVLAAAFSTSRPRALVFFFCGRDELLFHVYKTYRPCQWFPEERGGEFACKPDSVRASPGTIIYLGPSLPAASCGLPGACGRDTQLLLDLAPSGVCLAPGVSSRAGGLLHHRFTLAGRPTSGQLWRSVLCGTIRRVAPPGCYPALFPCGVRTFLGTRCGMSRSSGELITRIENAQTSGSVPSRLLHGQREHSAHSADCQCQCRAQHQGHKPGTVAQGDDCPQNMK